MIKSFLIKIIIKIINIVPKKNIFLCSLDYYHINGKKIIRQDDNVYLFSKYLLKKGEKIYYFDPISIKIRDLKYIFMARIIIHKTIPFGRIFLNKNQYNIILGYFTPFKADKYLEKLCSRKYGIEYYDELNNLKKEYKNKKIKYITTSSFTNTILSKSNNLPLEYFKEIGMVRNNVEGISLDKFKEIFSLSKEDNINKIILYAPTFRDKFVYNLQEFDLSKDDNIFGYENIEEELSKILEKNNIYIIIKLHKYYPYYEEKERKILTRKIKLPKNCLIFSSEIEDKYKIGIYNLFDISDAMIADYSSISFDYLLKDKPIFYNIFDIDEYREYRGFSYEPIEDLMAGEIIKTKEKFLECLDKFGENYKDIYKENRKKVSLLVNGEKQENINEKIYKFIKEYTNDK